MLLCVFVVFSHCSLHIKTSPFNVDSKCIEVELKSGELAIFERYNIQKCIVVGDFVKVVGGIHIGHTGFIDCMSGPDISILETFSKEVLYFYLEIVQY